MDRLRPRLASCSAARSRDRPASRHPTHPWARKCPAGHRSSCSCCCAIVLFELQQHGQLILLGKLPLFEGRGAGLASDVPRCRARSRPTRLAVERRASAAGLARAALVQFDQQVFNHWVVKLQQQSLEVRQNSLRPTARALARIHARHARRTIAQAAIDALQPAPSLRELQHNLQQFPLQRVDRLPGHASDVPVDRVGPRRAWPSCAALRSSDARTLASSTRKSVGQPLQELLLAQPILDLRVAAQPRRLGDRGHQFFQRARLAACMIRVQVESRGRRPERRASRRRPRRRPASSNASAPCSMQEIGRVELVGQRQNAQVDVAGHEQLQHFVGPLRPASSPSSTSTTRIRSAKRRSSCMCASPNAVPSTATAFSNPN